MDQVSGIFIEDPTKIFTNTLEQGKGFDNVSIAIQLIKLKLKDGDVSQERYDKVMRLLESPDKENQKLGVNLSMLKENECK